MTSVHTPVVLWCWVGLWIASHSQLCINRPSEPGRLTGGCVCQWVNTWKVHEIDHIWEVFRLNVNCGLPSSFIFQDYFHLHHFQLTIFNYPVNSYTMLHSLSPSQSDITPLAYTDVPETARLARSINTQPAVRRNSETNPTSQHNTGMYWSQ